MKPEHLAAAVDYCNAVVDAFTVVQHTSPVPDHVARRLNEQTEMFNAVVVSATALDASTQQRLDRANRMIMLYLLGALPASSVVTVFRTLAADCARRLTEQTPFDA